MYNKFITYFKISKKSIILTLRTPFVDLTTEFVEGIATLLPWLCDKTFSSEPEKSLSIGYKESNEVSFIPDGCGGQMAMKGGGISF